MNTIFQSPTQSDIQIPKNSNENQNMHMKMKCKFSNSDEYYLQEGARGFKQRNKCKILKSHAININSSLNAKSI